MKFSVLFINDLCKKFYFRNGDTTTFIYLQRTLDIEMGKCEAMRRYSDQVDIIWMEGYVPDLESLNFIDKEKVVICWYYREIHPSSLEILKSFQNFLFTHCVRNADEYVTSEAKSQYVHKDKNFPEDWSRKDYYKLFGSTVSRKPMNFDQLENSARLYSYNYISRDESIKTPLEEAIKNGSSIEVIKEIVSKTKNVNEQISPL